PLIGHALYRPYEWLVYTRGDVAGATRDTAQTAALLGSIDTVDKAVVLLRTQNVQFACVGPPDFAHKSGYRGDETRGKYSISEWWLDPYTRGPGAHQHPEDDVFFVIEGTMSFLVGGKWIDAPKGSLVIAPGGT